MKTYIKTITQLNYILYIDYIGVQAKNNYSYLNIPLNAKEVKVIKQLQNKV